MIDAQTQSQHAARALATGASDGGREAYASVFHELLVAHELGHWLQGFQPEVRTAEGKYDDWAAEYNANQIMIAFSREHPSPRYPTEARFAPDPAGARLGNAVPPPPGVSIERFFNSDRMTIVRGGAYGWYQGEMTRRALAERPRPSFCALVGRWLPFR